MNIPCNDCTGCLACYNICPKKAINVGTNEEGFYVPSIDLNLCVACGKCEKVCPIQSPLDEGHRPLNAYAAWAKNAKIVRKSSSGGIFSIIAETFIDGGIVYGAAFDKDWNVYHSGVQRHKDIIKLRGSKYLQSYIGLSYKEIRHVLSTTTRKILFVGTPCQVAALRTFAKEENLDSHNLFSIDLACHGTPTPKIFKEYIQYLERNYGHKIIEYTFRDKKWSWCRYNTKAKFSFLKSYIGKWEEDVYMRGFLREYFLRPSCHNCKYACATRQGDITLSDYWNYYPRNGEIENKDRGVSVILVNNTKGQEMVNNIKDKIIIYNRPVEDAINSSQPFSKPFPASPQRKEFWRDYNQNGFGFLIDKYFQPEPIIPRFSHLYTYGKFLDSAEKRVKNMIATNKRLLYLLVKRLRQL